MSLRFEWDSRKAASNLVKHGVSFEEASTVFGDVLSHVGTDPRHSIGEARYILIGNSARRRLLIVMYTERGGAIRVISARRLTRKEKEDYEERYS